MSVKTISKSCLQELAESSSDLFVIEDITQTDIFKIFDELLFDLNHKNVMKRLHYANKLISMFLDNSSRKQYIVYNVNKFLTDKYTDEKDRSKALEYYEKIKNDVEFTSKSAVMSLMYSQYILSINHHNDNNNQQEFGRGIIEETEKYIKSFMNDSIRYGIQLLKEQQ